MATGGGADAMLRGLNAAQKTAVTSPADVLQILAPPGSGKTKTLTSRVAYLLLHTGYEARNIIVATFTVKAAREMKERIGQMIGQGLESKLILGTFHSIARRYLCRYGHLIGIRKSFGIADSADSLAIIKRLVKDLPDYHLDPNQVRGRISGLKARGVSPAEVSANAVKHPWDKGLSLLYQNYEDALELSNLLDYDDLLLRCRDLLRQHPSCVSNVEVVLVDEFQDTNLIQYELMNLLANQRRRITCVGDPDQSIYGFRNAEIKNLSRMKERYPDLLVVLLEENYRSSGAILLSALEVIQQDTSRPNKPMTPTHGVGTRPVLRKLPTPGIEADWIVSEIQRCRALTGELLGYGDFAILIRSGYLSRNVELALGKAGIPHRLVGGHRFFDRVEVKVLLDYLRCIGQPDNGDALERIINVPSRKIGAVTIKALLDGAQSKHVSLSAFAQGLVSGRFRIEKKISKAAENKLSSLINLLSTARERFLGCESGEDQLCRLLDFLIDKLDYKSHLESTYKEDYKDRWANVYELLAMAKEFSGSAGDEIDEDALPEIQGLEQQQGSSPSEMLASFLTNVALSSEPMKEEELVGGQEPVTISTIHAAKGLEWPVVFVVSAYEGSIPHSRAEDHDEERRLLYVAMTRAKALLNISVPMCDSHSGLRPACLTSIPIEKQLSNRWAACTSMSSLLSEKSLAPFFDCKGPSITSSTTQSIAQILRRPCPPEADIIRTSNALLGSRDDDHWPTNGRFPPSHKHTFDGAGNSTYTTFNDSSKRRRLDESGKGAAVQPVINPGFVTAGSHLQGLAKDRLSCVADKERRKQPGNKARGASKQGRSAIGSRSPSKPPLNTAQSIRHTKALAVPPKPAPLSMGINERNASFSIPASKSADTRPLAQLSANLNKATSARPDGGPDSASKPFKFPTMFDPASSTYQRGPKRSLGMRRSVDG
ncbi:MAG: hypothetical protein M1825_005140 [Sarcosagium campestre]|nr:MAG: hypothetical protein M1825_005140 [Sarcosagium campestre]